MYVRLYEEKSIRIRLTVYYAALITVSVVYLALRYSVLSESGKVSQFTFDLDGVMRLIEYLCLSARYLVLPFPQPFYFQYPAGGIAITADYLIGGALLTGAVYLYLVRPGARFPLLWIAALLAPTSLLAFHEFGLFTLRFLYPPTVMAAVLASAGLQFLRQRHRAADLYVGAVIVSSFFAASLSAARDFNDVESFASKVLNYDHTHGGSYASLGKHHLEKGSFAAAERAYTTGARNAARESDRLALSESLALLYANAGDYHKSLSIYRQIASSPEMRTAALIGIGNSYWMLQDHERALAHYREAISLDDSNFDALFNYALLSEQVGDADEAASAYRSLLALPPTRTRAGQIRQAKLRLQRLQRQLDQAQ